MSTLKVFHLKNCDSCRKAIKALDGAGVAYDTVDVRADGLLREDVAKIVAAVGWDAALNRRSSTWRAMDTPDVSELDNVNAVQLIVNHPLLLKRPAITDGERVTVGWKEDAQSAWLG